jgi:hypothetical protein
VAIAASENTIDQITPRFTKSDCAFALPDMLPDMAANAIIDAIKRSKASPLFARPDRTSL